MTDGPRHRAAGRYLRAVSLLVPAARREEWLREWSSEVWYDVERRVPARRLWGRLAGAVPHALWVRGRWLREAWSSRDVRYALRGVRREPGFSALVIGTLGLGMGVTVAMFTIVNAVLLRPLPYPDGDGLVFLYGAFSRYDAAAISPPDFLDYREQNRTFEILAGHTMGQTALLAGDEPERVSAFAVTANLLDALGVRPALGRGFRPEEETGSHAVVMLSDGLWRRRYAADPAVLGTEIRIDGEPREIIGVLPPMRDARVDRDLWLPMAFGTPGTSVRRFHFMRAIGRLRPGIGLPAAQADMDRVAVSLERLYPENATWRVRLVRYRDVVVGDARRTLLVLLGAVALVLLIACANVANLLLAKATARADEVAVRKALGASGGQLVRQLLTESVVLALAGGAVGLAVAYGVVRVVRVTAAGILPRLAEITIDGTVLAFALCAGLATGIAFGLAPALQAGRAGIASVLATRRTTRRGRAREVLVVAQIALSVMLLAGAGLLLRSLRQLQAVDGGFAVERILTARVVRPAGSDRPAEARFEDDLLTGIRALPGVESASATTMLPLVGGGDTYYWPERDPPATPDGRRNAQIAVIADDYFPTLDIPVAGDGLSGARPTDRTVVVSRSLAARVFPDVDAIGERLVVDFGAPAAYTIVGVAGDVRVWGPDEPAPDILYLHHRQPGGFGRGVFDIVVRTAGDPLSLTPQVRGVLRTLDRESALADVRTMRGLRNASMGSERFAAGLFAGFAGIALLMAVIGLYGVLAYVVARRMREIGIRLALGAAGRNVFAAVLGRGMALVLAGLVLGQLLALATGRLLRGMLFETAPTQPIVLTLVVPAMAFAGLAACVVPALRAMRADPVAMLRSD